MGIHFYWSMIGWILGEKDKVNLTIFPLKLNFLPSFHLPVCSNCISKYFITLKGSCRWERKRERKRARKWKRAREEDRNSWGCVGRALTTGMHEEAASIPQASGWFRDTTERTAQQPTCKSRWPSPPSAILGLSATVVAFTQQPHK